jgi:hypothetical protein
VISHSDHWHWQTGGNEHLHAAPRQMLIPARQTAILFTGHDTAQPPQLARAGIPQARGSNQAAPASVDATPPPAQRMPISPADQINRRMKISPHGVKFPSRMWSGRMVGVGRDQSPVERDAIQGLRAYHIVTRLVDAFSDGVRHYSND